ncbi:DUF2357 domain-containing protein [Rouxiella sp. WC2420]|uniref:DUF2357 domain-containing protein n=1 Tax=Rouxiella sp. WC2420 TaxID=3234145 RepID=A0AB39VQH8_9GAMM
MTDLIRLQTAHFELTIWCSDIEKRQDIYTKTLEKRSGYFPFSEIRFYPPLELLSQPFIAESLQSLDYKATSNGAMYALILKKPLFFENIQYQIEWEFKDINVQNAQVAHRLNSVNDCFRFTKSHGRNDARLTGSINTNNDIGWFKLPLRYQVGDITHESTLSFEVLPTKMDLQTDLAAMYQSIDEQYPLWRFSLAEKTEQDAAKGSQRGNFPLLWLANFNSLRRQFENGLKVITQAPHSRLKNTVSYTKADRLKGRLSHRLSERVQEDIRGGKLYKRYRVEKKHLSVDTPENRFIKMVVKHSKDCLAGFHNQLTENNKSPDKQRISKAFLDEITSWEQTLTKMHNQEFLREVGNYNGLSRESLVLQQKTGYSAVYSVWQQLKFYLDVFSNQASVSMKSVAEIYEVWCFLTLREILVEDLGFKEISSKKSALQINSYMEYQFKDGLGNAFKFTRDDGLKARLAHEPIFKADGSYLRSHIVPQKPDIFLEITFPNGKQFIWLFDAKYRIKTFDSRFNENIEASQDYGDDLAPEDAINQMHRYRDALIRMNSEVSKTTQKGYQKSRPVFGAFALYPGFFNQNLDPNPYAEAIEEIGIGAFALLPSEDQQNKNQKMGRAWLTNFLIMQVGLPQSKESSEVRQESLLLNDSVRIPHYGMQQALYPDLVMTAALAGTRGRKKKYFDAFEAGDAKWYHVKEATFVKKYAGHVVPEIKFIALASTSALSSNTKKMDKLWPVNGVSVVSRRDITEEQAGSISNSEERYYLFKLGKPLTFKNAIEGVPHQPIVNSLRLTTINRLENSSVFSDVQEVYPEVRVKS